MINRANQLTGFYMRATLAFNGLTKYFTLLGLNSIFSAILLSGNMLLNIETVP